MRSGWPLQPHPTCRSSRSTTTGIATSLIFCKKIVQRFVEAVGPLQQGLRPVDLHRLPSFSKVEAVGPLQQGLRLLLRILPQRRPGVEAVGPLQQGLRRSLGFAALTRIIGRSSRSTTTGIATVYLEDLHVKLGSRRSSRSTTTGIATIPSLTITPTQ